MKKSAENRYPHSATLFKFCKQALEIRYQGNVKVIDQDVGAILGYDPADCSHWKKGKKNIRDLTTMRSIATHLNIDERLLIDVASGKIGLDEAIFEFKGYGSFALDGRNLENLKKDFFRNPTKWQNEGTSASFEELFNISRESIAQLVNEIQALGNFQEAPVYLPEVVQNFSNIRLESVEELEQPIVVETNGEGIMMSTAIKFKGNEMRPYRRFMIAKEIFKSLSRSNHEIARSFKNVPELVLDIQSNIFAGMLLVPANILKKEVEKLDGSFDIVQQLASTFWVSKALLNQRLSDYMENLN